MSQILNGLNDRQRSAIVDTLTQSALVLAGPGAGKTNTLTKRITYLIEQGIDPYNIMAITFTNKASKEMQDRMVPLIGEEQAKRLTMGTFHKICIQMLKRFGDRIGIDPKFSIADPGDQQQALRHALSIKNQDTGAYHVKALSAFISDVKNKMMTPQGLYQSLGNGYDGQSDMLNYQLYVEYQTFLDNMNMLDFDDLLMYAVKLLEQSEDTRRYYQKRYRYIHADEYQDTNPCQYELIRLLSGKARPTQSDVANVFLVGDVDQSIYAFRGSDISIILGFQQDFPEAKIIKLEQNYRSTKAIVHVANELIKHNQQTLPKTIYTTNENGEKVKVFRAYQSDEEVEFVTNEIRNLVAFNGYKYSDMTILYRANFLSREMEKALMNKRIPYMIVGGVSFYERMEIKDTIAYLKVIANPRDDIAMERILSITPSVGKTTIQHLKDNARGMNASISEMIKHYKPARKQTTEALEDLRNLLQELYLIYKVSLSEQRKDPVSKMLEMVWKRTQYKERLAAKKTKENISRMENLQELEGVAKLYEARTENASLEDFLEGVILQTSEESKQSENAVTLQTVHSAKGLENKVVFVIGMNEEIFPHKMSLDVEGGIEEERRLAYVAITRAEDLCYMSYAKVRSTYGATQFLAPSRFLDELPKEAVQFLS